MGDAYTAVADDENTLFYNPAALGRHTGASIRLINPKVEVTDALDKDLLKLKFKVNDRYQKWPKAPEAIAQRILGIPLHISASGVPGIKMQHFGLSFFVQTKATIILENAIHPNLNIDYRLDRGLIMGHAFTFGKRRNFTSLGVALKQVQRNGLIGRYDLFSPQLIKFTENSKDYRKLLTDLGYSQSKGWGADIGVEKVIKNKKDQWIFGASLLDIGEIHFKETKGKGKVPNQKSSFNLGASYSKDTLLLDYVIDIDYKNIIDPIGSKLSKFSIGTRLKFPFISLYFGQNGGYKSYGIGIDLFMFQLLAGFYGIETGYDFKQREGERAMVLLRLMDVHFDL